MTENKRRIVALLVRFDNAYEEMEERHAEAYSFDAAFDGGEFSGPAHAASFLREADAMARRLGFASAAVADEVACRLGVPRVSNPFREPNLPE